MYLPVADVKQTIFLTSAPLKIYIIYANVYYQASLSRLLLPKAAHYS